MRAVGVIPHQRQVCVLDHPSPVLREDDQVKIRNLEVGICGTDREICSFAYGQPPRGEGYLVLGHESLGLVEEVGSQVRDLKPGNLVVPSVRRPCARDECRPCRADRQDFCATGDFIERGIKLSHGYMTHAYVEREKYLTRVPEGLMEVAVLAEPLTIAEKAMAQVWETQRRLPWVRETEHGRPTGRGLRAVVLGAGPIGILGAMKLLSEGFETYVYSRSRAPNPKAELIESIGAKYISIHETQVAQLVERTGPIDLVYEAAGVADIAYDVLGLLGLNGVYVFTGIPSIKPPVAMEADLMMRNLVLKNQIVIGTVNADAAAFGNAISDLGRFLGRWTEATKAIVTERTRIDACRRLLLGKATGIKNVISFNRRS